MNGCTECKSGAEPWMDHRVFGGRFQRTHIANIARDHKGQERSACCTSMKVNCGQDVKQARTFSSFTAVRSGLGLEV
jgi:hypothetical protein